MKKNLVAFFFLTLALTTKSQDNKCPRVGINDFPKKDMPPSDFKPDKLKFQASENYYYGIGVPIDYIKARYLAFIEMKDSLNEPTVGGSAVLMMIYANGYGVNRNFDISKRLACGNIWSAPAELEGRMQHLNDMQSGKQAGVFDLCDDITSGMMSGVCESIVSDKAKYKRQAIADSIIASWPAADTAAYNKLRTAASNFFNTRVENEVDLSGTARDAFITEESDSLERGFMDKILRVAKCNFKKYTSDDFKQADAELNSIYVKIMHTQSTVTWGTITKAGIKSTQIKWLPYRDAWVAFGKIKCPDMPDYAWEALLTLERNSQLQDLIGQ